MKFPPISRKSNVMDIAPMVDLVFLLLVFFMVGSKFATPALEMELPSASSGNNSESENIVISVDRKEKIYLAGMEVDQSSLTDSLSEMPDFDTLTEVEEGVVSLVDFDGTSFAHFGYLRSPLIKNSLYLSEG